MSEKDLYDAVHEKLTVAHRSFSVGYKNENRFQKLIGLLVYPFNDEFMERYTTTLGSSVYFPSKDDVESDYRGSVNTLAHESVHIWDGERRPVRYNLGYAFPQILAIPLLVLYSILGSWIPIAGFLSLMTAAYFSMWLVSKVVKSALVRRGVFLLFGIAAVASYAVGAVYFSHWWAILAGASLIPLVPWAAKWRAESEYRGYAMTIAVLFWLDGRVSDRTIESISRAFTSMAYFRMDPDRDRVMKRLRKVVSDCQTGRILVGPDAAPYRRIHAVVMEYHRTKRQATGG